MSYQFDHAAQVVPDIGERRQKEAATLAQRDQADSSALTTAETPSVPPFEGISADSLPWLPMQVEEHRNDYQMQQLRAAG